jgi:hypothetical protein
VLNKKQFVKESRSLNIKDSIIAEFYQKLLEFMMEFYRPTINWDKMMEIEDKYLWPVLRGLGNPALPIYEGAKEEVKNEFIITIRNEIATRLSMSSSNNQDHREYLRLMSKRRIEFFEMILDITPGDKEDFRKERSWTKYLIAGGTILALGLIGKSIAYSSKDKKEKK